MCGIAHLALLAVVAGVSGALGQWPGEAAQQDMQLQALLDKLPSLDASKPAPEDLADQQCTALYQKYTKHHQQILSLPRNQRRLAVFKKGRGVWGHGGGLGDVVASTVGIWYWAMLTGRAYQLYWPGHEVALITPFVNTSYTDDESYLDLWSGGSREYVSNASADGQAQSTCVQGPFSFVVAQYMHDHTNSSFEEFFGHRVEIFDTNKGLVRYFYDMLGAFPLPTQYVQKRKELDFPEDAFSAMGCGINYLFRLVPSSLDSLQTYTKVLRSKSIFSISIHIRSPHDMYMMFGGAADDGEEGLEQQVLPFIDCAQQIEKNHMNADQTAVWFVLSDNQAVREHLSGKFPDKVMLFHAQPDIEYMMNALHADSSHTGDCSTSWSWKCQSKEKLASLAHSYQEWYLFALSDYQVISNSGFSTMAVARSMQTDRAFFIDSLDENLAGRTVNCQEPTSWQFIADQRAGY